MNHQKLLTNGDIVFLRSGRIDRYLIFGLWLIAFREFARATDGFIRGIVRHEARSTALGLEGLRVFIGNNHSLRVSDVDVFNVVIIKQLLAQPFIQLLVAVIVLTDHRVYPAELVIHRRIKSGLQ